MNKLFFFLAFVFLIFSCQSGPKNNWKAKDLLPHGIPLSIMAPDSVDIKVKDYGPLMKDVTIKGGEDYSIQLFASDAETNDIAAIKAIKLKEVKSNRYFQKIITEEENGFIYETAVDTTNTNYSFCLIRLQGDREFTFQAGLSGTFTLEQVEDMYEAVKGGEE